MIVTKYCSRIACEAMAKGEFRIGTLSGFAGTEGDGGLFDDLNEGKGAFQVGNEDASGETFSLMGIHFSNNSFAGPGVAIHVELTTDANAFCLAKGWYDEQVHSFIRDGRAEYRANPEYTSYIEFDLERLFVAIRQTAASLWGNDQGVLCKPVSYGVREKLLSKKELSAGVTNEMTQKQLIEICFTKPPRFEGEQEFRFLILHNGDVARIETSNMEPQIRRLFADSILNVSLGE